MCVCICACIDVTLLNIFKPGAYLASKNHFRADMNASVCMPRGHK